jgi:protein-S-isoprenylcysteine O-methyltransferase Ste14
LEILKTIASGLFAAWCASELAIALFSVVNRSRGVSEGADRFSYFAVWFSTVPPIAFEYLIQARIVFAHGFGSLSALFPLLGYVGCLVIAAGITIRVMAVATLRKQFTLHVAILEHHEMVDTGLYGIVRHPAYLGHLVSLLGIGLILGNWVGLAALVILPLIGIGYRVAVEEKALARHFGPAYQAYAARTKRLLPGIW